jgi:hypothetical protein
MSDRATNLRSASFTRDNRLRLIHIPLSPKLI